MMDPLKHRRFFAERVGFMRWRAAFDHPRMGSPDRDVHFDAMFMTFRTRLAALRAAQGCQMHWNDAEYLASIDKDA
jgi:hypothetical protein